MSRSATNPWLNRFAVLTALATLALIGLGGLVTSHGVGVLAFVGVSLQGLLGGLRVTLIKDELGIFHAALAQAFLVLICAIALFTSKWWNNLTEKFAPTLDSAGLRRWFVAGTVLIFAQL